MDANAGIFSEEKLASYQTVYKENVLSKPQEISLTVTAEQLYGQAFIYEQIGTKEISPVYSRFSCGMDEITKVYVNHKNKNSPINVQCDDTSKATVSRRRIILPCFTNYLEIVRLIDSAKAEYEKNNKDKPKKVVKTAAQNFKEETEEVEKAVSGLESQRMVSRPKILPGSLNDVFEKAAAELEAKRMEVRARKAAVAAPDAANLPPSEKDAEVSRSANIEMSKSHLMGIERPEATGRSVKVDDILGFDEILGLNGININPPSPPPAPANDEQPRQDEPGQPQSERIAAEQPRQDAAEVDDRPPEPQPEQTAPEQLQPEQLQTEQLQTEQTEATQSGKQRGQYSWRNDYAERYASPSAHSEREGTEPLMAALDISIEEDILEEIPANVLRHGPAEIEELSVPEVAASAAEPVSAQPRPVGDIETLDPEKYLTEMKEREKARTVRPKPIQGGAAPAAKTAAPIIKEATGKGRNLTLEEFETFVKRLRAMVSEGEITENEFAIEKKRLLAML
jgi:hypothetical protein